MPFITLGEGGSALWPGLFLVLGVALITASMIMRLRKRRRILSPSRTPDEQLERNRQLRGMHGDLEQLMVEIEQLARRFGTQLDAKSIELERLLSQADQRIEQLRQLASHASPAPGAQVDDAQPGPAPRPPVSRMDDPLSRSVYQLADSGYTPPQIAAELKEHIGKIELILALREA
jgi:hypothetical protein